MADIRNKINEFLNDPKKKKVTITVPKGFKVRSTVNPVKLLYRKPALFIQKWIIPSRFKNWLLRSAGLNIGEEVCIPHYITWDPYFPELITVDRGSIVGGLSTLLSHELKGNKLTLGRIHVHERVLLAGLSTIHPGVTVEKESITGMHSHITKDVPRGSFVVGNDRFIKKWSPEEIERHFGESKHDKNYRKKMKKQVKEFRENPKMKRIVVRYEGERLNPGNEWYLSRPMWRIYYNALFAELARILPGNWLRKLMLRMQGATIGKNVYIGRNVVFDQIYGDLATVEDNVHIGDDCYLDGHSYTITETIFGRVHIGKNTHLDDDVHVFCGVTIGKNVIVKGTASCMKDIPDGETWTGIPAKKVE